MSLRKRPQILLQPLVGRQVQHLVRLIPAACFPHRHGVSPAVARSLGRAEFVPSKATFFYCRVGGQRVTSCKARFQPPPSEPDLHLSAHPALQ